MCGDGQSRGLTSGGQKRTRDENFTITSVPPVLFIWMLSIRRKWKLAEEMKETQDVHERAIRMQRFHRFGASISVHRKVHYNVTNI